MNWSVNEFDVQGTDRLSCT